MKGSHRVSDPVCGDGQCDMPDEYPGFGRFDCAKDCGEYSNVTTLPLKLQDMINASQTELGISLPRTSLDTDPASDARQQFCTNFDPQGV